MKRDVIDNAIDRANQFPGRVDVSAAALRELLRTIDVMFSSERFFDRHRGCDPAQCNILQMKAARDRFQL